MGRIILGVIVGFVVWSIVWVGGEQTLANFWADYGNHSREAEKAFVNGTALQSSTTIVLVNLARSFITSLIAGYMTALVAGEYKKSTMVLGIILVLVGVAVEYMFWNIAPAWYHILFVLFLLPMTVVGGKLRRAN